MLKESKKRKLLADLCQKAVMEVVLEESNEEVDTIFDNAIEDIL